MKTQHHHSRKIAQGFTLVELLVAIVILTLIMVGVAQLMNSTMLVTLGSFKHMDADAQARMVMDRMAYDISKMVQRTDVDYYFPALPNPGDSQPNSQMAFFSESSGYYPDPVTSSTTPSTFESSAALIGYRIGQNATTNNYELQRLSKGLIWNGVSSSSPGLSSLSTSGPTAALPLVFLPQTIVGTWPNVATTGADPDYQGIGDQIFRLEIHYLVQNSTTPAQISEVPNIAPTPVPPATTSVPIQPGAIGYFSPKDVLAVIVSIAVLDSNSQKSLANPTAQILAAQQELKSVKGANLPLTEWKNDLATSPDYLGLNKNAAAQVRFYQRYCYLNHVLQ